MLRAFYSSCFLSIQPVVLFPVACVVLKAIIEQFLTGFCAQLILKSFLGEIREAACVPDSAPPPVLP